VIGAADWRCPCVVFRQVETITGTSTSNARNLNQQSQTISGSRQQAGGGPSASNCRVNTFRDPYNNRRPASSLVEMIRSQTRSGQSDKQLDLPNRASYPTVPMRPRHTNCQKPCRKFARMGLWGTWISGKVRGLCRTAAKVCFFSEERNPLRLRTRCGRFDPKESRGRLA
jgi:hypothetical protein